MSRVHEEKGFIYLYSHATDAKHGNIVFNSKHTIRSYVGVRSRCTDVAERVFSCLHRQPRQPRQSICFLDVLIFYVLLILRNIS